ncbi:MAG: bifunctional diaminohydroxyphosphoribosylaminopyrimidine deaminase/5-amino-6-(5-phosphoribosylamino)uracil reductase RibD [Lachnospiraceae bacterium]|jgi:diaminohydroxyphosphoribosylaminopyrimidine deaminase/5-amino-6-(5-phosphoribosylamino)uracil reductase|nr:bifunctional diaminohydroxyphosphoribosylaminopyrimidine deaminase/5-amino-6-(5-phosphoribosylamino)uracil reductase RibD [Lachnospiraceae bacterium]
MTHQDYMRIAIEEAKKGEGFTNPNPMVGAVLVKDGKIIGKDYHHRYGEFHAERNVILNCKEDLHGAAIYVTLEPCCHYGKTPPCTEIMIESGIKEVYIGSYDPNPKVNGGGIRQLENAGIKVVTDVLREECDAINTVFFHYIEKKEPYVILKYAMTADGKIATYTGASKWITGEAARTRVQQSRKAYQGIMVGIGTVLADDPLLTCRLENARNPIRIICDSKLRIPPDSNLVKTAREVPTIIAACQIDTEKKAMLEQYGCEILEIRQSDAGIDLKDLMRKLGQKGIDSILLEGGGQLNFSALQAGIVKKVESYIAPKLFGGITAKTPVGGPGVEVPGNAFLLKNPKITQIQEDILIEWEVETCLPEL